MQDDALFQRNFQQLSVYYTDMRSALPASELRPIVLGLNLVRLLVSNRIADFHIELETLPPDDQAHACIAFPKQLEQALMEGTYGQVLAASSSAPSPHMTPLLMQLAATVRDELAGCASAVSISASHLPAALLPLVGNGIAPFMSTSRC
jgi:26S proteasome regulatory subunit N12